MRAFQIPVGRTRTVALPFWLECLSQFHSSGVTTLQTQVSFVSIDHRGSPSVPSDWVGWSLSAGFTPLEMPFPDACRLPLASRPKCCSFEQLHKRLQAHPSALLRTGRASFPSIRLASCRFSPFGLSALRVAASGSSSSPVALRPVQSFPLLPGRS
jgi:hypothetical protein